MSQHLRFLKFLRNHLRLKNTLAVKDIVKGPKVLKEPPQINLSKAWKMYINGAKSNLGVGEGVVLESPKGAIF